MKTSLGVMEPYLKPIRKQKYRLFILCLMEITISLFVPFLLSRLINSISSGKGIGPFVNQCIIITAFIFGEFFVNWYKGYKWFSYAYKAVTIMRKRTFTSLLFKPLSFFENSNIGDMLNKVLNDTDIFAGNLAISGLVLVMNLLYIVGVLTFMMVLNFRLAIIVAAFIPIYFLLFNRLNRYLRETGQREREAYSTMMQSAQEKLQGIETIHYYGCQNFFAQKFGIIADNYFVRERNLLFYKSLGTSMNELMVDGLPLVIIIIGLIFILFKQITIGALVAFYAYIPYITEPIKNLSDFNILKQNALAVKGRIESLLKDEDQPQELLTSVRNINSVKFKNVFFSYKDTTPIINNLNLDILPGDRIAVVGLSGSGKSTFLKLLLKQLMPVNGTIYVNETPLESISSVAWHDKIAYLGQSPFVFEGSVLENIAFDKTAPIQELSEALFISATDIFCAAEKAAGKIVGAGGGNFSGGEKQRIAIARTMLKQSSIIILDEATAALDMSIEKLVVQRIHDYLAKNPEKILITVTHRPEILKICNKKIEFAKGREINLKNY